MIDLDQHYTQLYNSSISSLQEGTYQIDDMIDSNSDNRYGITLLIRPQMNIRNNIQVFLDELKQIDPELYYYPNSDIHITVMSIISCYAGFDLRNISVPAYVEIIKRSIHQKDIEVHFRGITVSPSCIMIQGFYTDNTLSDLRDNLRTNFKGSALEETIDKRYSIQTAHATVARFKAKIRQKEELIGVLEKYRNYDFGKFKIRNFDLVYNDWYQREPRVKLLHRFVIE